MDAAEVVLPFLAIVVVAEGFGVLAMSRMLSRAHRRCREWQEISDRALETAKTWEGVAARYRALAERRTAL